MSLIITELTKEQVIKIATNYALSATRCQVLKITKYEINENGVAIVNVRCVNKDGEKMTIKTYIGDHSVSGMGGLYERSEDMLNAEIENRDFGIVEEKSGKVKLSKEEVAANKLKGQQEKAAEKEKKAFNDFVKDIQGSVNYAMNPKRTYTYQKSSTIKAGAKRSIKRHGVEKLESIIHLLDQTAQDFVQECINEILEKEGNEQLMKDIVNRTKKFTPALESVLDQIEESVKGFEQQIYVKALDWFAIDENGRVLSKEQLEAEAKRYVEHQKARLMYAAVRYLGGLDIKTIDAANIRNHTNGFEGVWKLTLADGSKKTFRTHTIIAEGYVQRAHYRYLVNLS
jgi:hypothetical protein